MDTPPDLARPQRRRSTALLARLPKIYVMVAAAIVMVDQLGKYLSLRFVSHRSDHLVGPLYIANLYDHRASLFGQSASMPAFIAGFVLVLALAGVVLVVATRPIAKVAGAMIFGGALSNFASSVFDARGVPNFLCYDLWYFCNAADVMIVIGVTLAAIHTLRPSSLHAISAALRPRTTRL